MKKFLFFLSVLLFSSLSLFAKSELYFDAINSASEEISDYIGDKEAVAFISLDFDNLSFGETYMRDFEKALINRNITVVERRNIEPILEEYRFQINGFVSDDNAVSIGNMAGADLIITGSAKNMVSYLGIELAIKDVETGTVRRRFESRIKYDTYLDNLLNDKTAVGSQKLSVYARAGVVYDLIAAHEDMVGTSLPKPVVKPFISFVPAFGLSYNFANNLSVNLELEYYVKNGMTLLDFYNTNYSCFHDIDISYSSIDIPLFLEFRFIKRPVSVSLLAGAYVSFPVGDGNISFTIPDVDDFYGAVNIDGILFGLVGGFNVGIPAGPGYVVADVRYFQDFDYSKASGDLIGDEPQGLLKRSGLCFSAGYRISLGQ